MTAQDMCALAREAASGDERAWTELVDRYSRPLWAIGRALRLSQQDIADAVQTTWMRLLQHLDRLHGSHHLGGWLATVMRNECRNIHRARRRETLADDWMNWALADRDEEADARLLREERHAELWSAVDRLPRQQRELLRLLCSEPAPAYAAISTALDMPTGSIGPTRARALGRLRQILGIQHTPPPRHSRPSTTAPSRQYERAPGQSAAAPCERANGSKQDPHAHLSSRVPTPRRVGSARARGLAAESPPTATSPLSYSKPRPGADFAASCMPTIAS